MSRGVPPMLRIIATFAIIFASLTAGDVLYTNLNANTGAIHVPGTTSPLSSEASVYAAINIFVPVSLYGGPRLCNVTNISVVGANDITGFGWTTIIPGDVNHALNVDLYETYTNLTLPSATTKIGSWRSAYSSTPWPPTYGQSYSGWTTTSGSSSFSMWTSDVKQYWMAVSVRLDTPGYVGLIRVVNTSASRLCGPSACFTQYTRYIDIHGTFGFSNWTYATNVYQSFYSAFSPSIYTLHIETQISTDCSVLTAPTQPPTTPPVPPPVPPPIASPIEPPAEPIEPPIMPPVIIPVSPPVKPPALAPVSPPVKSPIPPPIEPPINPPQLDTNSSEPVPTEDSPTSTPDETPDSPDDSSLTPDDITPTPIAVIVLGIISAISLTLLSIVVLCFLIYRSKMKRIAERSAKTSYELGRVAPDAETIPSDSSPPDRKKSTQNLIIEAPIALPPSPPTTTPPPPTTIPKPPPSDEIEETSGYSDSDDYDTSDDSAGTSSSDLPGTDDDDDINV
jgi:hypothetical protein